MPLFGRTANLILANQQHGTDFSRLRFRFEVKSADVETPNTAIIRVYNVSPTTLKLSLKEYDSVILQGGYGDSGGVLFHGTIKQFKFGKENNTDSFLDILAADGDLGYNFGIVNRTLPENNTAKDRLDAIVESMDVPLDPNSPVDLKQYGGVLPRGKVLFGMGRQYIREWCVTNSAKWTMRENTVTIIPLSGFLPGEAVKINSQTGMVGIPESTDNGVFVRMLLNPLVKIGNSLQINDRDINQTVIKEQMFPNYNSPPSFFATTPPGDGIYRVMVVEHSGDTRGGEYYTDVTCLAIDNASQPATGVRK